MKNQQMYLIYYQYVDRPFLASGKEIKSVQANFHLSTEWVQGNPKNVWSVVKDRVKAKEPKSKAQLKRMITAV